MKLNTIYVYNIIEKENKDIPIENKAIPINNDIELNLL
jgi:hypothetical protein